jgi:hypothetical protein
MKAPLTKDETNYLLLIESCTFDEIIYLIKTGRCERAFVGYLVATWLVHDRELKNEIKSAITNCKINNSFTLRVRLWYYA